MHAAQECPLIPVSWGELIDKVTILRIKQERIGDAAARANVARELALLNSVAATVAGHEPIVTLTRELQAVNEHLWDIEDAVRVQEAAHDFGCRFVALARSVYQENDRRAALKREINRQLGSSLVEEKSYSATAGAEPMRASAAAGRTAASAGRC